MTTQTLNSGEHVFEFEVKDHTSLNLNFNENTKGTYILKVSGKGALHLNIDFKENSRWTFLWLNQSHEALNTKEYVSIHENTTIKMNYGELTGGDHKKTSVYEFKGTDTHLDVKGASVITKGLNWDLKALHHAKRSFANLDNHAIVLEDGTLNLEVTGQIDKGYSGSETHQITRVMNFGSKVDAVVFPKLLIDENDVAASHAATVGKPNEEHIYYLQARGITRQAALKLLMKGYLLPIVEDIDNETIKNELIKEIEMKVESQWT